MTHHHHSIMVKIDKDTHNWAFCRALLQNLSPTILGFLHQRVPQGFSAELSICCVSPQTITHLNHTYRNQKSLTNVLAFPTQFTHALNDQHPLLPLPLGDIVISPHKACCETMALQTSFVAHFAHLIFHALLHLFGYQHNNKAAAHNMSQLEQQLLDKAGL